MAELLLYLIQILFVNSLLVNTRRRMTVDWWDGAHLHLETHEGRLRNWKNPCEYFEQGCGSLGTRF